MITPEQYVGGYATFKDWNDERKANAEKLLKAIQPLEDELIAAGVPFPINPGTGTQVSGSGNGGFRPQKCPVGAARSSHKEGLAVDRYDPKGKIDNYLLAHPELLEKYGIYIEHPLCTGGWSHWSIKPPGSGHHIFYP